MRLSLYTILALAVAGGLGTLARVGITHFVQKNTTTLFPFGTLVVNIIGCLLFGLIWSLSENQNCLSENGKLIILTGFMGALTTFSTYAFMSSSLISDGRLLYAFANIATNNTIGIIAIFGGIAIGKSFA